MRASQEKQETTQSRSRNGDPSQRSQEKRLWQQRGKSFKNATKPYSTRCVLFCRQGLDRCFRLDMALTLEKPHRDGQALTTVGDSSKERVLINVIQNGTSLNLLRIPRQKCHHQGNFYRHQKTKEILTLAPTIVTRRFVFVAGLLPTNILAFLSSSYQNETRAVPSYPRDDCISQYVQVRVKAVPEKVALWMYEMYNGPSQKVSATITRTAFPKKILSYGRWRNIAFCFFSCRVNV